MAKHTVAKICGTLGGVAMVLLFLAALFSGTFTHGVSPFSVGSQTGHTANTTNSSSGGGQKSFTPQAACPQSGYTSIHLYASYTNQTTGAPVPVAVPVNIVLAGPNGLPNTVSGLVASTGTTAGGIVKVNGSVTCNPQQQFFGIFGDSNAIGASGEYTQVVGPLTAKSGVVSLNDTNIAKAAQLASVQIYNGTGGYVNANVGDAYGAILTAGQSFDFKVKLTTGAGVYGGTGELVGVTFNGPAYQVAPAVYYNGTQLQLATYAPQSGIANTVVGNEQSRLYLLPYALTKWNNATVVDVKGTMGTGFTTNEPLGLLVDDQAQLYVDGELNTTFINNFANNDAGEALLSYSNSVAVNALNLGGYPMRLCKQAGC